MQRNQIFNELKPAFQPKGHLVHVFGVHDGGAGRGAVPRRLEARRVPHHDDCNREQVSTLCELSFFIFLGKRCTQGCGDFVPAVLFCLALHGST